MYYLKKRWRKLLLLIILIVLVAIIIFVSDLSEPAKASIIALIIGLLAISKPIVDIFFSPILKIDVIKVPTPTIGGNHQIWYHLWLKNDGFTSAHNVRVKIRDNESMGWVNLMRSFNNLLPEEFRSVLSTLAPGEDDRFDIGFADPNDVFSVKSNIVPLNQQFEINSGEKHRYYIDIVADDAPILHMTIDINFSGYMNTNVDNFVIKVK